MWAAGGIVQLVDDGWKSLMSHDGGGKITSGFGLLLGIRDSVIDLNLVTAASFAVGKYPW